MNAAASTPGQRFDAPRRFRVEIGHRFAARIFQLRQRDFHREHVLRIETGIDVLQSHEALQEQSWRRRARRARARLRATTSALRRRLRRRPVVEPRPPSFNASVNSGFPVASAGMRPKTTPVRTATPSVTSRTRRSIFTSASRGTVCAPIARSKIKAPDREHDAHRAADDREEHAFGQASVAGVASAGAQRDANGELAFARAGAGQQHGGEIRARDQQDHRDRADQNHAARARIPPTTSSCIG